MIHPEASRSRELLSQVSSRTKSLFVYYFTCLHVSLVNLVPIFIGMKSYSWHESISTGLWVALLISTLMTIPLVAEFLLDVVVTNFYSVNELQIIEHRFGHVLMLVSLVLPGLVALCAKSVLLSFCIVSICQSFAVISIYGNLLASNSTRWNLLQSMTIAIVFIASQLGMLFSYVKSDSDEYQKDQPNIIISLLLTGLCLVMHIYFSRRYVVELIASHIENTPVNWVTNDVVCFVYQAILFVYFVVNIVLLIGCLCRTTTVDYIIVVKAIKQIVLGFTAIIIPGRIIRNNFIQIKRDMENKDTFMRYITHEIRGPLSTTNLGLDYLKEKLSSKVVMTPEDILEVITEMKVTCDLATSTLNDLLMFDKIESNMLEISKTDYNICKFVNSTVHQYHMQAIANELNLDCEVPELINRSEDLEAATEQEIICHIDTHKMEQVLRNLLNNAMKFTPGGGKIHVVVSHQNGFSHKVPTKGSPSSLYRSDKAMANPVVRIEVTDTGPGISKDNLPRLFGQYVQFDADKLQGGMGSGLGLWLSKAIVERHGGKIGAHSDGEGKGCSFYVELPCVIRNAAIVPTPAGMMLKKKSLSQPSMHPTTSTNALLDSSKTEIAKFETRRSSTGSVDEASFTMRANSDDTNDFLHRGTSRTFRPRYQPADLSPKGPHEETFDFREREEHSNSSSSGNNSFRLYSKSESQKELKVLLVDDNALARKMVGRMLAGSCTFCQYACNGSDAVEKVTAAENNKQPFDIILMDYYMPVMNGPEAIREIRDRGFSGTIIALSATDSEFEPLVGKGVDKVMMKPFNIEAFQNIINEVKQSDNSK